MITISFLSIEHTNTRATMPPGRKRQVSLEEDNERRRKTRQRRKRKFGAIKKVHDLKKVCGFEAALFLFHPETGQISTYRSTNNKVCDSWFKDIVSLLQ
jgi:hypothetical protein